MELKIEQYQIPESIKFNFDELKQELTEKVSHYETLVYTEDQIKEAKLDRSNLNKLKKALSDERIRRKKEYMATFSAFEEKIKELEAIIDKAIEAPSKYIEAAEEQRKVKKFDAINEAFSKMESPEWLTLNQIFDSKWLNASTSEASVVTEMAERITRAFSEFDTLANLSEFSFEAKEVYKSTLDMSKALNEATRLSKMAKLKAEEEKKKATDDFSKHMNPPVEPKEEQVQGQMEFTDSKSFNEALTKTEEPKQWVSFQANVTITQARLLKKFFEDNHIEFKSM